MPNKPIYLIGELAKRANVNIQTVRYYERIKLLAPDTRKSNVRHFSENTLKTLLFIKNAQSMGFQLEEIRELLDLRQDGGKCKKMKAKAEAKVEEIRKKIKTLKSVEKNLLKLIRECDSTEHCSIIKGIES